MKYPVVVLLILLLKSIQAQDLSYARSVVDTLASPEMKGRGYVQKGDKLAAEYIRNAFKQAGLQAFAKGYFQKFTMPVNTFPGKVHLTIDDTVLVPGEDYLVEAGSPSVSGIYHTFQMAPADLLQEENLIENAGILKNRFLVVTPYAKNEFSKEEQEEIKEVLNFLKYHPRSPVAGIIELTHNKLTWSPAPVQYAKPAIIIHADSLSPISKIDLTIESKFIAQYNTRNVVGYVEGKNADSLIVLTAHYDHLGMMGSETIFPGANDNASGVAMLLSLARYYAENQPEYTIVFIAFAAEEIGLVGSKHFVENPLFDLDRIKFLINFDLAGTGDEGIQVVNGSVYKDQYDLLREINRRHNLLEQVKIRGEACNSDHCFFHLRGVPSFFIYTLGGIQAYHDIYDKPETLPLTEFEDYFKLITRFLKKL